MKQKILILINTGTPDAPDKKSVRRYLSEFLNDPSVIDLPWIARKLLVNLIIVPFRTRHSADLYSRLWTNEGSPLKVNMDKLIEKLSNKLRGEYLVTGAMRYGNPSITSVLQGLPRNADLTVFPLYPQYANATSGSAILETVKSLKKSSRSGKVSFIDQFSSNRYFIKAYSEKLSQYEPHGFDHIVFSYHSLPLRQIRKMHPRVAPQECQCQSEVPEYGERCYRAACYQTTRQLAESLKLDKNSFTTAFQSRMSKNWLAPFTEDVIKQLAAEGKKRILVAAPSFVSDCLETIIELKEDYGKTFIESGGREFVYAESLNYDDCWVDAVTNIIGHNSEQNK